MKRRLRRQREPAKLNQEVNEDTMTQPLPGARAVSAENELDIRGLFRTLWAGKFWIIGIGLLFAHYR